MTDLRDDLRTYFDYLADEAREAVHGGHVPVAADRSRSRHWLVAAAIVIVAVLGGTVWLVRSSDNQEALTTAPADNSRAIARGWERVPDAFAPNTFVNDVAAGPQGFVAVGYRTAPGGSVGDPTASAIWTSRDGTNWAMIPAESLPGAGYQFSGVTYWDGRYLAWLNSPDREALWSSSDGLLWGTATSIPASVGADARLFADESGLFVYGSGGLFFSPDGTTWDRSDLDTSYSVRAIQRFGDRILALATVPDGTTRGARILESSDGLHWTGAGDLGNVADPGGEALAVWNGNAWAVTHSGGAEDRSSVWRFNGREWARVASSGVRDGTAFDTLTPAGRYLVATGFDSGSRPGGWVSTDGSDWVPMADALNRPPGGRLDRAAYLDGKVVALNTAELKDVYVWTRPVAGSPSLAECAKTRTSPSASPDGLPEEGSIEEAYVRDAAAAADAAKFMRGVTAIDVEPYRGRVWSFDSSGEVVVRIKDGYGIAVTLADPKRCPSSPFFVGGAPTRWLAPRHG